MRFRQEQRDTHVVTFIFALRRPLDFELPTSPKKGNFITTQYVMYHQMTRRCHLTCSRNKHVVIAEYSYSRQASRLDVVSPTFQ